MPSDIFVAVVAIPMMIVIALLFVACALIRKLPGTITWRNVLHGYAGMVVVLLAYAVAQTAAVGVDKVARGDIADADLATWIPQWSLYLFFFIGPFQLVLATLVGLPLFLLLRRIGFASIAGVAGIAVICSSAWAAYYGMKHAWWCDAPTQRCAWGAFSDAIVPTLLIALGFAAAAGLPLLRNRPFQAAPP